MERRKKSKCQLIDAGEMMQIAWPDLLNRLKLTVHTSSIQAWKFSYEAASDFCLYLYEWVFENGERWEVHYDYPGEHYIIINKSLNSEGVLIRSFGEFKFIPLKTNCDIGRDKEIDSELFDRFC